MNEFPSRSFGSQPSQQSWAESSQDSETLIASTLNCGLRHRFTICLKFTLWISCWLSSRLGGVRGGCGKKHEGKCSVKMGKKWGAVGQSCGREGVEGSALWAGVGRVGWAGGGGVGGGGGGVNKTKQCTVAALSLTPTQYKLVTTYSKHSSIGQDQFLFGSVCYPIWYWSSIIMISNKLLY